MLQVNEEKFRPVQVVCVSSPPQRRLNLAVGFNPLSLPKSFQFCAGGAAEISRWRQPPESPSLLPSRPGRGAKNRSHGPGGWRHRLISTALPGRKAAIVNRESIG